jgi:glycosyltransferase involved in cell wall biosynthesis
VISKSTFVSVIFPTRNEVPAIRRCIEGFLSQSYPHSAFEVVIADSSTDGTREILELYQEQHRGWLVVIHNASGRIADGYNLALQHARGGIVCTYIGHAVPSDDYVEQVVVALADGTADLVGGRAIPVASSETYLARSVALALRNPFAMGRNAFTRKTRGPTSSTHWMAVRRSLIDQVGGFDSSLERLEDCDWYERIMAAGGRALFEPSIQSRYLSRGRVLQQGKIQFLNSWHRIRLYAATGRGLRFRHVVPAALVVVWVGLALALPGSLVVASGCIVYIAVVLVSCAVCSGPRRGMVPGVCAATIVVHAAQFMGIVAGGLVFGVKRLKTILGMPHRAVRQ